jgi:hypothetical protein
VVTGGSLAGDVLFMCDLLHVHDDSVTTFDSLGMIYTLVTTL